MDVLIASKSALLAIGTTSLLLFGYDPKRRDSHQGALVRAMHGSSSSRNKIVPGSRMRNNVHSVPLKAGFFRDVLFFSRFESETHPSASAGTHKFRDVD